MKRNLTKKGKASLFRVLNRFTLGIWVMMALLCGSVITYSCSAVNEAVVESQQSILAVATSQITSTLNATTNFLEEGVTDYVINGNANTEKNTLEDYLESERMAGFLEIKMASNPCITCVFFTDTNSDLRLSRFQSNIYYTEKFAINDYLAAASSFESDVGTGAWHFIQVDESYYLMQYYRLRYGGLGVLIGLDDLLSSLDVLKANADIAYCLTDAGGLVLTGNRAGSVIQNDAKEYRADKELRITATTNLVPLRVTALRRVGGTLYNTSWIPFVFGVMGIVSIGLVAWYNHYLRRQFVAPVANLLQATKIVVGGNLDYEAPDTADTEELSTLTTSFNYMTKEVKNQKIRAYEDEILQQKMELKNLRLQLSPHFYLNSINTILSLSRQGRNQEIQDFIIALSQYLRYLFADSGAAATVQGEISHTEDYIRLQQIRYPDVIFFMSETEPDVRDVPMPRLVVQTFAENIFKHAFDGQSMLSIFIRARKICENGTDVCCITVEDNGNGFSEEFLQGLQRETSTGLRTIRKTLQLSYGREDLLRLYNSEHGGACVELRIPMQKE